MDALVKRSLPTEVDTHIEKEESALSKNTILRGNVDRRPSPVSFVRSAMDATSIEPEAFKLIYPHEYLQKFLAQDVRSDGRPLNRARTLRCASTLLSSSVCRPPELTPSTRDTFPSQCHPLSGV